MRIKNIYKGLSIQVKASLWFIATTVLLKGISFITIPIFTRVMTTEQYGIYNVYLTWYEILTVVGTLNLESCAYMNALTKFDDERKKEAQVSLLELSFVITTVLMVLLLLCGEKISSLLGLPKDMLVLMVVQIYFVPAINFWTVKHRFSYKYKALIAVSVSMAILNVVIGVCLVVNADIIHQAYARVVSIVLVQIVYGFVLFSILNRRNKIRLVTKYWKWAILLHIPLLPHTLSLKILGSASRIMINSIIGATEAAIYSVSFSVAIVVNLIKTSIVDTLRPWIYEKLKRNETSDMKNIFNGILIFVAMLTMIFMAFGPEVIYIVAPKEYHDAIYCMPPVMIGSFFTFLYSIFSIIEMYYEETKKIMIASVSAAVLNIVLNLLFLERFGYIVAAFTTLVCYIFLAVIHYCMMCSITKKKGTDIRIFDTKTVCVISVALICMMFLFEAIYTSYVLRYLFLIILSVIIFIKRKYLFGLLAIIKQK